MKVNRSDLLNILASLRPGIAKKEVVPQSGHFVFTGTEIATFNDQICITHPFETEEVFSVKADDFYRMIDGISAPEIVIEVTESKVIITALGVRAQLNLVQLADSDRIEHLIKNLQESMIDWKPVPDDFLTGMSIVSFSAARSAAMGALACIFVTGDRVYSADNWRASRYVMNSPVQSDLLVLAKDALELIKFPVTDYCATDNWTHFLTKDNATFSCRKIIEKHTIRDEAFNVPAGAFKETFPAGVKEAIESMTFIADDVTAIEQIVSVEVNNAAVVCTISGGQRGEIIKSLAHKTENSFVFDANPNFLKEVLSRTKDIFVSERQAYFVAEKFDHVMCLVVNIG